MPRPAQCLTGALGLALMAGTSAPVLADTLEEALIQAYLANPTLQAARANQRATDELVPIEKASGRPDVRATALLAPVAQLLPKVEHVGCSAPRAR